MHREPEWLFPFQGMAIGDSFFIPTLKPSLMIFAIEKGAKRAGIKVKCYVTTKHGAMGVRAWRMR